MITAVGLITESQGWAIAAMMVGNVALNGVGYLVAHLDGVSRYMFGPAVRWTPTSSGLLVGRVLGDLVSAERHLLSAVEKKGLPLSS